MAKLTESTVEEAALEWLNELGYAVLHGPEIEPEGPRQIISGALRVKSTERFVRSRA
jgi:hypothetical protein